jgi:DNA primase
LDAKEIKQYIITNDLIDDILGKVGCHSIANYSNEKRCALPNDSDNSKVSLFLNDDLGVRIFTKGETVYGDIFNLIMFINNISFPDAFRKCASLLGLNTDYKNKKVKKDHLSFFRKHKKSTHNDELKTYDISLLDKYDDKPHIDLIRKDGIISSRVLEKYHIKFDYQSNRILFPHFHYEDKSKVVGVIGRTVNPAYESLKIPKYFPLIAYEKSKNLYGLSHNIENVKKEGYIIVFESEKSVLKADMYGFQVGVSVGCHELSSFQKKLLISLSVEIIISFDKDVEEQHVLNICKELSRFRKVSYIKDKWELLKAKDSSVDRGRKKFMYLLRNRINYREGM